MAINNKKTFIFLTTTIGLNLIIWLNFVYTFPVLAQPVNCTNYGANPNTKNPKCFSVTGSNNYRGTDSNQISLEQAFAGQKSNIQVQGTGRVIKLLPDDLDGGRHQRFILKLASGQTLLIAHNIDLAPRISLLHLGDLVSFFGEYEWNSQGGVIHWTHRDPNGRHIGGWIKHAGKIYQ
ncbi:MAG: DUF3465 domain-containing protein [Pleurocapsa minor HA4230-MV1]|jgi:hypothetical protein|nr:DUF3465 domain-containing protein [Pleurocapsa minor HA4230-MV1]